jgi:Sap-like sulfolipid-1-addressing protein
MAQVVVLALAAAVYPTLLAGVIVILARPRPVRKLVGFLLGGMTISIAAGIAIVSSLRGSGAVAGTSDVTKPAVDIVAGVASLGIAWAVWRGHLARVAAWRRRRRPRKPGPRWTDRALGRSSGLVAFMVGVVLNLPGIWYLAALTDIAAADISFAEELFLIVLFNVIMFLLVEIPLAFYLIDEERARRLVDAGSRWARAHSAQLGIGVACVVGVWLVAKGIVGAVS